MRLLNVKGLLGEPDDSLGSQDPGSLLITAYGSNIPKYAILSHKWLEGKDGEVQFADIQASQQTLNYSQGIGRASEYEHANESSRLQALLQNPRLRRSAEKIRGFCAAANSQGYRWVWDDTFCINDATETEKTESIASMYTWYREAGKCFAFLADVEWGADRAAREGQFKQSVWFTRGWTLQELLAPTAVEFYDRNWRLIGSREEVADLIHEACGIDSRIVNHFDPRSNAVSTATKLSWACRRTTAKPEDRVYSLFGLFNVSIFIRYGEGLPTAFRRLQEAIISQSQDESIFAWRAPEDSPYLLPSRASKNEAYGLLAPSIECFSGSVDIHERPEKYKSRGSYTISNGVLHFPVPLKLTGATDINDLGYSLIYLRNKIRHIIEMPIECWTHRDEDGEWVAISLYMERQSGGQWRRVRCHEFKYTKKISRNIAFDPNRWGQTRTVQIPQPSP